MFAKAIVLAGVLFAKSVVLVLTGIAAYAIGEAIGSGLGMVSVSGAYAGWILTSDLD